MESELKLLNLNWGEAAKLVKTATDGGNLFLPYAPLGVKAYDDDPFPGRYGSSRIELYWSPKWLRLLSSGGRKFLVTCFVA